MALRSIIALKKHLKEINEYHTRLQSMAVSNEISGVQEQSVECASVQFYQSVHFKCAHKIFKLYLLEILTER